MNALKQTAKKFRVFIDCEKLEEKKGIKLKHKDKHYCQQRIAPEYGQ